MRSTIQMLRRLLGICVGAGLAVCAAHAALAQGSAPRVHIDSGAIVGENAAGVASFKGIPFAQPPVGALRWRAPQGPDRLA